MRNLQRLQSILQTMAALLEYEAQGLSGREESSCEKFAFIFNTYDKETDEITSTKMVTTSEMMDLLDQARNCGMVISVFELGDCLLAWRNE